ncbi:hypothetical protein FQA39_LY12834 [Lamprigera yunnana]|nr:hypothetical protein FQA39_LY12834 [Lamprigera yunnana]
MTFKELKLNDAIIKGLSSNGFEEPTEVQAKVIPIFLANKNVFVKSIKENNRKTQAIIVAPTRELAVQIMGQAKLFGSAMRNVKFVSLIGGEDIRRQTTNLRDSQVVIGTPGRIQDHLNRGTLRLNNVQTIILDEADEMLKMGFKNEIDAIFKEAPDEIQVGLFSATINAKVKHLATAYMQDYEYIEIDNVLKVNNNITNTFIFTKGISKDDLLIKVIKDHDMQRTIIFSNTKSSTDKISKRLRDAGIKSLVINGDKRQSQRTRAIKMLKTMKHQF